MAVTAKLRTEANSLIPWLVDYVDCIVFDGTYDVAVTVPTGAKAANFSCTADFYVSTDAISAAPAASVTDGTAPILNPSTRRIPSDISTFYVFSATASSVLTIEWFID